jgi:MFS transporter, MFS domain-containing protein family, molybdate-anion transporter
VYKYDKQLDERYVAALYATGFVSAAISAAVIGQLADRYGRKKACLVYCAMYSLCCLSMLSDNLSILFAGKLCGGISTTLLYSVFDAWMITEYHQRGIDQTDLSLGTLYGWLTSLNSIVAITTGVVGEILVSYTGRKVSPFLLAVVVFGGAAGWISSTWVRGSRHNKARGL